MNKFLFTLIIFFISVLSEAQSVRWAVKPMYNSLQEYAGNLYKIHVNGKVGFLNRTGLEVLPALYDSITPFVEGYALAVNYEKGRYAVKKIINCENSTTTSVIGAYFLTKYPYFSNGMLCVTDVGRYYGYLLTSGQLAIECKYLNVHPFCERHASATLKTKNVVYLNLDGSYMQMEPGQGLIIFGSSFCNGEAVVYTMDRKGYVVNDTGHSLRPFGESIEKLQVNAKDYRISGAVCSVELNKVESYISQEDGVQPFEENGAYGYRKGNMVVLPAQFSEVSPFVDGYARVKTDGKYGILKLIDGTFSGSLQEEHLKVDDGKSETAHYQLSCPQFWKSNSLMLHIDNSEGYFQNLQPAITGNGCFYHFVPIVRNEKKEMTYNLSVHSDGLVLWKGLQNVQFRYIAKFAVSRPIGSTGESVSKANEHDVCSVFAIVTNISSESGTVRVTLGGKGTVFETMYIPAHGSRRIILMIPNVKDTKKVKFYARLSSGSYSERLIELKAFY